MTNPERRNKTEDVDLYLGFLRKKHNPDSRPRCIRRISKGIDDDFMILKQELETIGGIWRIHKTVNKRSTVKAFNRLQHYMLDNPDCHTYLDSVWKTILLQTECRAERRYMLDVDTKDKDQISHIVDNLLCDSNILETKETPNGFHIIVEPFDVRIFEKEKDVTILKDGYIFMEEVGRLNG